jgi:hypothetical protein
VLAGLGATRDANAHSERALGLWPLAISESAVNQYNAHPSIACLRSCGGTKPSAVGTNSIRTNQQILAAKL